MFNVIKDLILDLIPDSDGQVPEVPTGRVSYHYNGATNRAIAPATSDRYESTNDTEIDALYYLEPDHATYFYIIDGISNIRINHRSGVNYQFSISINGATSYIKADMQTGQVNSIKVKVTPGSRQITLTVNGVEHVGTANNDINNVTVNGIGRSLKGKASVYIKDLVDTNNSLLFEPQASSSGLVATRNSSQVVWPIQQFAAGDIGVINV